MKSLKTGLSYDTKIIFVVLFIHIAKEMNEPWKSKNWINRMLKASHLHGIIVTTSTDLVPISISEMTRVFGNIAKDFRITYNN